MEQRNGIWHDHPGSAFSESSLSCRGTLVVESAIVSAGFEYRQIRSCADIPASFSRVLSYYVICLTTAAPSDICRDHFMVFKSRLGFTANSPSTELHRMSIIAIRTLSRILPIVLQRYGVNEFADSCRTIDSIEQAIQVTRQASGSTSYAAGAHLYSLMPLLEDAASIATDASFFCRSSYEDGKSYGMSCISAAVRLMQAASTRPSGPVVWEIAGEILNDCIAAGERHPARL